MVEATVLRGSSALPISVPDRSPADARAARPLTLTRRGRLVLIGLPIVLGVSMLVVLGAFLTSTAQAGEGPARTSTTVDVTVVSGETLWGIAEDHAPDRDPRDVVAEIVELNNLTSSVLQAGQSLSVPVRG